MQTCVCAACNAQMALDWSPTRVRLWRTHTHFSCRVACGSFMNTEVDGNDQAMSVVLDISLYCNFHHGLLNNASRPPIAPAEGNCIRLFIFHGKIEYRRMRLVREVVFLVTHFTFISALGAARY